ncbi:MAG: hypothetical protein JSS25_05145 [Proteobacteria bacterium]|nr:hypothetical protein [Pseudomonadota bacterium]
MGIFSFLFEQFDQWADNTEVARGLIDDSIFDHGTEHSSTGSLVNPATGLPMIDDSYGGVDVGGSPFGMDIHESTLSLSESTFGLMDDHMASGHDSWASPGSGGFDTDW